MSTPANEPSLPPLADHGDVMDRWYRARQLLDTHE